MVKNIMMVSTFPALPRAGPTRVCNRLVPIRPTYWRLWARDLKSSSTPAVQRIVEI